MEIGDFMAMFCDYIFFGLCLSLDTVHKFLNVHLSLIMESCLLLMWSIKCPTYNRFLEAWKTNNSIIFYMILKWSNF